MKNKTYLDRFVPGDCSVAVYTSHQCFSVSYTCKAYLHLRSFAHAVPSPENSFALSLQMSSPQPPNIGSHRCSAWLSVCGRPH